MQITLPPAEGAIAFRDGIGDVVELDIDGGPLGQMAEHGAPFGCVVGHFLHDSAAARPRKSDKKHKS